MGEDGRTTSAEEPVRALLAAGNAGHAATLVIRTFGAEVFGFVRGALGSDADADEVFAVTAERVWKALGSFRWQCSLRTWVYVIARNEIARFLRGARRRNAGRVTSSELERVVEAVRTETRSMLRSENFHKLNVLREELPVVDRTLLILRVDRELAWEDVARAFLTEEDGANDERIKREAARLRKRFQLVRRRLADRAREEGLLS